MKKAVALTYPEEADAPYISAIAKGWHAERLLAVAKEHHVPVVRDDVMANLLTIQHVGDIIPEEAYSAIAKVFAYIAKMEHDGQ